MGGEPDRASALEELLARRASGEATGPTPSRMPVALPFAALPFAGLAAAVVVSVVGWRLLARPAPVEDRMPVAVSSSASSTSASPSSDGPVPTGGEPDGPVSVHVAGAVTRPGVVSLGGGSRVADALAASGGPTDGADLDRLNLAAPLVDGSRILVPVRGVDPAVEVTTSLAPSSGPPGATPPGAAPPGAASPQAPVPLNTATAEELETLPGVGPATAAAIIAHRESNGPFPSVEDLLEVRGIGEARLEAIRDLVTTG